MQKPRFPEAFVFKVFLVIYSKYVMKMNDKYQFYFMKTNNWNETIFQLIGYYIITCKLSAPESYVVLRYAEFDIFRLLGICF